MIKSNKAWELWSQGDDGDGRHFVAAFKDKGAAQRRAQRLRRSHPHVRYMLKQRRVPARMLFGKVRKAVRDLLTPKRRRTSRDPEKTRDYEYYVYPEPRVSGPGVKVPRGSSRSSWDLTEAKRVAKKMGSPAAIYSISKGRFVGYIHRNGRFIAFR